MQAFRRSLGAKLVTAVIVCAVLPLAAVGAWLASNAAKSGELLLRTQLDSAAARGSTSLRSKWQHRKSDVLFLAGNAPVRESLRDGAGTAPPILFGARWRRCLE